MKKLNMVEIKSVSGGFAPEIGAFLYSSSEAANGGGAASTILTCATAGAAANVLLISVAANMISLPIPSLAIVAGKTFVLDAAAASLGYWSGTP
jgi:hypothetical protein